MKETLFIAILCLSLLACEKVVEIEDTNPDPVVFCQLDPAIAGNWTSDSVHIMTMVDTIDSAIIDRNPTLIYEIEAVCAETDKRFLMTYTNFAGVETEDINSTNYRTLDDRVFTLDPFEENSDTALATFRMSYDQSTDSNTHFWFFQKPNAGQVTRYDLYMRRL